MILTSHSWSPSPCPVRTFTLEAEVGGPKRPRPPPFAPKASVSVYSFIEKMKENFASGLGKEKRGKKTWGVMTGLASR